MKEKIKYGIIVPRSGGSVCGCKQVTGRDPEWIFSYEDQELVDRSIRQNFPDIPYGAVDSADFDLTAYDTEDIDFVFSVCPCGGMSSQNTSSGAKKGVDAPQNDMMYDSAEFILDKIKPKVLIGENAEALFAKRGEPIAEKLHEIAVKHGYSFSMFRTNLEQHGIPHQRKRVIYFFWNSETCPVLEWMSSEFDGDIEAYLDLIPEDASLQDTFLYTEAPSQFYKPYTFMLEKTGLTHREFVKKYSGKSITKVIVSEGLLDECIEWMKKNCPDAKIARKPHAQTYVWMHERYRSKFEAGKGVFDRAPFFITDRSKSVVRSNVRRFVHPREDRYLNFREYLHLLGFPHDFEPVICYGSVKEGANDRKEILIENIQMMSKGIAVPFARYAASQAVKFISGELKMSDYSYVKQDNTKRKSEPVLKQTEIEFED